MKKIIFLFAFLFISNYKSQVVQLIDSYTKENVNFEKITSLPVGAKIDNIIFATKNGNVYKRVFASFIDVRWFGAKSSNIDNLLNIQKAIDTGFDINLGSKDDFYNISGTLVLKNNQKITSDGATIKQKSLNVPILDVSYKTNVDVSSINFIGHGNDYIHTSSSLSVGIYCYSVKNLKVSRSTFSLFTYASISGLRLVDNVTFENNIVTGFDTNYLHLDYKKDNNGIALGGKNIIISNNKFSGTSQGITIAENSANVLINDNSIFDIWLEHGMYLDAGISDLKVINNNLRNLSKNGIKVQNANYPNYISQNVIISGNIVDTTGTGGDGILVNNTDPNPALYVNNLVISGNILNNIYQSSINVRFAKNVNISQNVISNSVGYGIYLKNLFDSVIVGNTIIDTNKTAIYSEGFGDNYYIASNVITNYGLLGLELQGLSSAITVLKPSHLNLFGNVINGNGLGAYSFFNLGSDNDQVIMQNNVFRGFKYSAIRLMDSADVLIDVGNVKN